MDSRRSSPPSARAPRLLLSPAAPRYHRETAGRDAPLRGLLPPGPPRPAGAARVGAAGARPTRPGRRLRSFSRAPLPRRLPPSCAPDHRRRGPEEPPPPPRPWTLRSDPLGSLSPPAASPSWRPAPAALYRLEASRPFPGRRAPPYGAHPIAYSLACNPTLRLSPASGSAVLLVSCLCPSTCA